MSAIAELIADRGEAAASEEFFRSRPFLEAEGATHTLRIESDGLEIRAPLIVHEIPPPTGRKVVPGTTFRPVGPWVDAVSPYGYPGGEVAGSGSVDPEGVDFSSTGLVSAFLRHRLDAQPLARAVERNVVQIADPALPRKSRMSDRQQTRKNLRRGYEMRIVPGPDTSDSERAGFLDAYEQTMRRAGAAERYFFGAAYFDRILEAPGSWLALAHEPGGEIAAASVAVRSDGFLHYYLSGSADAYLRDSPMKNVLEALIDFSTGLALPLNLGGGISPGDPLEEFKRGFANREQPWRTSNLVCDRAAYERLSLAAGSRPTSGFFPAYRA